MMKERIPNGGIRSFFFVKGLSSLVKLYNFTERLLPEWLIPTKMNVTGSEFEVGNLILRLRREKGSRRRSWLNG